MFVSSEKNLVGWIRAHKSLDNFLSFVIEFISHEKFNCKLKSLKRIIKLESKVRSAGENSLVSTGTMVSMKTMLESKVRSAANQHILA